MKRKIISFIEDNLKGSSHLLFTNYTKKKPISKGFLSCSTGNIADLGFDSEIENRYAKTSFERVLNVEGKSIVPGLVDAHTHPVWAGDRVHEFAMKVRFIIFEETILH